MPSPSSDADDLGRRALGELDEGRPLRGRPGGRRLCRRVVRLEPPGRRRRFRRPPGAASPAVVVAAAAVELRRADDEEGDHRRGRGDGRRDHEGPLHGPEEAPGIAALRQ